MIRSRQLLPDGSTFDRETVGKFAAQVLSVEETLSKSGKYIFAKCVVFFVEGPMIAEARSVYYIPRGDSLIHEEMAKHLDLPTQAPYDELVNQKRNVIIEKHHMPDGEIYHRFIMKERLD